MPAAFSVAIARMRVAPSSRPNSASRTASFAPEMGYVRPADRLGQHDAVWCCVHDPIEIRVDQPGGQAVHAHEQARPYRRSALLSQERRRDTPGLRFGGERNRVLEIDEEDIGARAQALLELLRAVARHEEQRAHHTLLLRMKAWRRHSATRVPSCL